jgi:transcriptional regulator with XRE-family HTH domain
MINIRETLSKNLRDNRRKCGFTQAQLAEKADVSLHYLAMIELTRNMPKVDTIERLANALNVEIHELFIAPLSPAFETKKLRQEIITDLKEIVKEAVEEAFEQERKNKEKVAKRNKK